ncbi:MAG: NADPH-dependent 7-cyano-7-deazaguanine reductase QueF, partial [Campylobacter hyointestinalis]
SHEASINEIYDTLDKKLNPKYLRVVGDFNPRGNVHTVIELDSNLVRKEKFDVSSITLETTRKF